MPKARTIFISQGVGKPIGVLQRRKPLKIRKLRKGQRVMVKGVGLGTVFQYPVDYPLSGKDWSVVGVKIDGEDYSGHYFPANVFPSSKVIALKR